MAKSSDSRNHTKTILLFKDQDHDRHEIAAEIKEPSLQMRVWSDSFFPSGTFELGITDTPISQKASLIPPNAPIKPRKHVCKKDLKPKKLYFTDKELENERDDANCSQKSALLLTKKSKQKSKSHKRETDSSEKLNRDSLSAMLESIRLELDNKENRRQGHEKRTRINNSVAKERAKKNNCSQSSELSCNLRGEFVHFRI
ncbi:hypothetical protein PUN28_015054 [Cardiocondyla obscurior]|uniref:Uncharacterized protein n=1 Tax=Cardiocondyla obscurior TaxID=286306 RepID=A0AAW2EWS6_9HYME